MIERIIHTATAINCRTNPGEMISDLTQVIKKVQKSLKETEDCEQYKENGNFCFFHVLERQILKNELEALNYLLKSKYN